MHVAFSSNHYLSSLLQSFSTVSESGIDKERGAKVIAAGTTVSKEYIRFCLCDIFINFEIQPNYYTYLLTHRLAMGGMGNKGRP